MSVLFPPVFVSRLLSRCRRSSGEEERENQNHKPSGFLLHDLSFTFSNVQPQTWRERGRVGPRSNVRFGSEADMCSAIGDVRFTPNSDRESELPQTVMSALHPKADMCTAIAHVCFGAIADITVRVEREAASTTRR